MEAHFLVSACTTSDKDLRDSKSDCLDGRVSSGLSPRSVWGCSPIMKKERDAKAVEEVTASYQGARIEKVITKLFINNVLQLINRILLSSINPVLNNTLHRRADLLVAVQQVDPAVLDALCLEQRCRDLRHRLAAHLAPAGLGLAQLDLAGGVCG